MTLYCGDFDINKFKRTCRLPLFVDHWQTWRLLRTNRDNASPGEALRGAEHVVNWWARNAGEGYGAEPDFLHTYDHLALSFEPPPGKMKLVARANDYERMKACNMVPFIHEMAGPGWSPGFEIWVQFVWRGRKTDMPWPVYKSMAPFPGIAGLFDPWCPVGADYMVLEVYERSERPVPAPPPVWPGIPSLPSQLDPTRSLTGVLFIAGAGLVVGTVIANKLLG